MRNESKHWKATEWRRQIQKEELLYRGCTFSLKGHTSLISSWSPWPINPASYSFSPCRLQKHFIGLFASTDGRKKKDPVKWQFYDIGLRHCTSFFFKVTWAGVCWTIIAFSVAWLGLLPTYGAWSCVSKWEVNYHRLSRADLPHTTCSIKHHVQSFWENVAVFIKN